ncbi:two component regulator [Nitzschia inconspicua]|uniref:non-specific serine/threonine protein kinase n=1 Tax=Nitzschia inconspicua TaxID=303405 RepID=A0A9K3LW78_9STRA|nr:two component regulator [Nitzschia inconspicua]
MSEEDHRRPVSRRSSSRLSLSDYDNENDSDSSYELNDELRTEILHQLQVQSARKFLWDENSDEEDDAVPPYSVGGGNLNNHGSSSRFVSPSLNGSSFVWNSQEEIDLGGHLGAKRCYDVIETESRAGVLGRFFASRRKADRLGLHPAHSKRTVMRKNGSSQDICLCVNGTFTFLSARLFGARNTKRNVGIFLVLVSLTCGIFFAVNKNDENATYKLEPPSTVAPAGWPITEPEPFVILPNPQLQATTAPKEIPKTPTGHHVVGVSEGEVFIDTDVSGFEDLIKEEGLYDEGLFKDANSAQYKALHWIAKVDPARMAPSTDTFVLQRYALATIFFALSGADLVLSGWQTQSAWKDQTGWMTGAGYCSWYGVKCITGENSSDNSHVISLNLTANGLEGQLPAEIQVLSRLNHLDLSQNEISGTIPKELGNMMWLRSLFVRENKLTGSVPSEIGKITSLQYLDLSWNDLNGQIPSEVGKCSSLRLFVTDMNPLITGQIPPLSGLTDLEVLSFKHNAFDGTIPDWLYFLTNLRQLRFQRNALSGKVSPNLANLSNLRYLQLSENSFTGELPDIFGHLKHLVVFDVVLNQFEGTLPSSLTALPKLEKLFLEGNMFSGKIPDTLGNLRALKYLYIQKNAFSSTLPDVFGSLSNLELFEVQENHLTGGIPSSLGGCTGLLRVDVAGNELSAPIPTSLGGLTSLQIFNLFGNKFTGTMPDEVCALRMDAGHLQFLVSDCHGSFECKCCTSCL